MLESPLPTFLTNSTIKKITSEQVPVWGLITYLYIHIKGWLRSECASEINSQDTLKITDTKEQGFNASSVSWCCMGVFNNEKTLTISNQIKKAPYNVHISRILVKIKVTLLLPTGHGVKTWAKPQDYQLIPPGLQIETAANLELIDRIDATHVWSSQIVNCKCILMEFFP